MFTIVVRAIFIYLVVVILYRFMGKRQLGEMQPFELVLTLIIADLATIPMAEVSVPVMHGLLPSFALVLVHFLLSFLSSVCNKFSALLNGKPVIVVNPNGVDEMALKKLNMSVDDLFEALRGCDCFSLEQVQYAIMETNGKVSVLLKSEFLPATVGDLKIKTQESELPILLISGGKILKENLLVAGLDETKFEKILKQLKIEKTKNVLILSICESGTIYFQNRGEHFQVVQMEEE